MFTVTTIKQLHTKPALTAGARTPKCLAQFVMFPFQYTNHQKMTG